MGYITLVTKAISSSMEPALSLIPGIPARAALELKSHLNISLRTLSELTRISRSTLHRRLRQGALLQQDESERVLRLLNLYTRAVEVFEDQERVTGWFSSHPTAFGGKTPLEVMKTEPRARWVEDILGRIDYGVFS